MLSKARGGEQRQSPALAVVQQGEQRLSSGKEQDAAFPNVVYSGGGGAAKERRPLGDLHVAVPR